MNIKKRPFIPLLLGLAILCLTLFLSATSTQASSSFKMKRYWGNDQCLHLNQYVAYFDTCSTAPTWSLDYVLTPGHYMIRNPQSGKCLTRISGDQIRVGTCNYGDPAQTFQQFTVAENTGPTYAYKNDGQWLMKGGYGGNRAHLGTTLEQWIFE